MVSRSTLLVGITGNSGCGQTTAASAIEGRVCGVCSLDRLGHRMLEKTFIADELSRAFGMPGMRDMTGNELRNCLSDMVFESGKSLSVLNSVLHPRMIRWVRITAGRTRTLDGIWVLEGALIYELGLQDLLDLVVVVRDTFERCSARLSMRDGIDEDVLLKRWESQMELAEKAEMADFVVENSRDEEYLRQRIVTIFTGIERTLNNDDSGTG